MIENKGKGLKEGRKYRKERNEEMNHGRGKGIKE